MRIEMAGDKIRELEIFNAKVEKKTCVINPTYNSPPCVGDVRTTWQIYLSTAKSQS